MNLTPVRWAAKAGIAIGMSTSRMSFDACEMANFTNSVPLLGLGIAGAVLLKML